MTRVLILCNALEVGGAERSLGLLVPGLRDRDFEPFVATLRRTGRYFDELRSEGIPGTFVDMRSRWDLRGGLRAYRLGRVRPDVVLTHSIDADLLGQLIAFRLGVPHVAIEQGGVGIPRGRHRVVLVRAVAPRVDRVVAVSATQIPELLGLGYKEDRVRVIPNGVAGHHPSRAREEVRKELGFGPSDVVAALVAGLRPVKRPDLFVEAVARARRQDPRVHGLVVGGGPQFDEIARQAQALDGGVRLLGERADVADLMVAADAVCLSSDVEGLPLAVVEAMSLAKPVISTDVGGLRDAVVPGETGWLVPRRDPDAYAEALVQLAADAPRARQMGEHGEKRFQEQFTAEAMNDRYADVLSEVVSAGRNQAKRR
ncbi:MAG: glycosyltransferase [Actinomycetota bacterium]|nr:glycosyltransferase [Actinomycetota bacterium]